MSTSQNKAVVRRLYEEFVNKGNLDAFDEHVADDIIEHEELPGLSPGREGVKQFFALMRQAFPDLRFVVEELIAEDDKVVARFRMQGTHRGEFMGAAPTGNRLEVPAIDVFRLVDGKIKEHWGVTDTLSMMQQLGAVPS
jgi:steroid delta-isomerase-like uncharacterized protein